MKEGDAAKDRTRSADGSEPIGDESRWTGPADRRKAFRKATLDLAMEGMRFDAETSPACRGYRDGTLTYAEARETINGRHGLAQA